MSLACVNITIIIWISSTSHSMNGLGKLHLVVHYSKVCSVWSAVDELGVASNHGKSCVLIHTCGTCAHLHLQNSWVPCELPAESASMHPRLLPVLSATGSEHSMLSLSCRAAVSHLTPLIVSSLAVSLANLRRWGYRLWLDKMLLQPTHTGYPPPIVRNWACYTPPRHIVAGAYIQSAVSCLQ